MAQMIIANRLSDGRVVFLDPASGWTTSIDEGVLIEREQEGERLLSIAKQQETDCKVVDPNLIDVVVEEGRRRPTAIREAIRAFGPSVRTDLAGNATDSRP